MRSVVVPQRGQAAVEELEMSKATTVVGVRTKSSRRKPGHCGRVSRRKDMACSLRQKGERWLSRDTLILPSSCTKSAGEPQFDADYHGFEQFLWLIWLV